MLLGVVSPIPFRQVIEKAQVSCAGGETTDAVAERSGVKRTETGPKCSENHRVPTSLRPDRPNLRGREEPLQLDRTRKEQQWQDHRRLLLHRGRHATWGNWRGERTLHV
ncbi:hypothetical protein ABVT39_018044 [Epinephelus coioides]